MKAGFLFKNYRTRYANEISWQVTRTIQKICLIIVSKGTWREAHYFLHKNNSIFLQAILVTQFFRNYNL